MTNKAKAQSTHHGREFLQISFRHLQKLLCTQLEMSSETLTHDGIMGEVSEKHFISILRDYLPKRYEVNSGIIIDSEGNTSDQIDVVVFDRQYTPALLAQQSFRYIPVEAVYAVFEVKPTINKHNLDYAADKAESVRRLKRTSIGIAHAGGIYKPKDLFTIIAGIISIRWEWTEGLSKTYIQNHKELQGNKILDCGLVAGGEYFDIFDTESAFVEIDHPTVQYQRKYSVEENPAEDIFVYNIRKNDNALAYFLFRLLKQLQSLGTVPAIDWSAYAESLLT